MTTDPPVSGSSAEPGPTNVDDLEKLIASLTGPATALAQTVVSGLIQVIRTMLDGAYARGLADGFRQATLVGAGAKPATARRVTAGTIPPGLGQVRNDRNQSEQVVTAEQLRRLQRRYGDQGESEVCA